MKEKEHDNQPEKNDTEGLNYEDLINDFSTEEDSDTEDTTQSDQTLDSFPLSELIGDESDEELPSHVSPFGEQGAEDENLAEIFNELDEMARGSVEGEGRDEEGAEKPDEKTPEEPAPELSTDEAEIVLDEAIDSEDGGYASILSQIEGADASETTEELLGDETFESTDESVDLDFLEEDTIEETEEFAMTGEHFPLEDEEGYDDSAEDIEISESELQESDVSFPIDESEEKEPEEAVVSAAQKGKEDEEDFLGLGGISGSPETPGAITESRFGATTEVLFEGVKMDFDEQIKDVTLAEILLAQGKKEEAADIFKAVSTKKGTTHWVTKRLNILDTQKTTEEGGEEG